MTSAVAELSLAKPALLPFSAALTVGWAALGAIAWMFAGMRHVPAVIALPIALGFLTEYSFYLLLGFAEIRAYFSRRFSRAQLAAGIACSALLPYFVYSIPAGTVRVLPGLSIILLMAAVAFWFLPEARRPGISAARDLAFLILLAVVIVSGVLTWIFPAPVRRVPMEVLGHISLVRSAILSVLLIRGAPETGIGFVPRFQDLKIGFYWFLAATAIALPLGWKLGQVHLASRLPGIWQSIGLLLGVFWVLALSEEFFFRALLQQWVSRWTGNVAAGIAIASILFGVCHLGWSRNVFPNWRYALLAAVLGLFCGAAFHQARSVRASMVTHAFLVSAWRLFFS